ncbi:MAG: molybdopterin-dependent oxidoreductase [Peptococcaceae bacterium]|jgi:aldehyde oxidoreductase|nr:molybdopterin-dependent oxidoreductase [Peptococcaceae bacterium]
MNFRRIWFNINGADRMFICNPEVDTLADVLRRAGLTGTKIGCGTGVCGACSVIVDGRVIRSCTRSVKNMKDYTKIITIEGIGTPMHLHPLQQAFITYGGVQCGICSPGFIVSAYALLGENPSPTREEVRAWFQRHRNACRCTGYKPIVDAVMAAAAVMRGEKTMEDITFHVDVEKGYYNAHTPKPSALSKVCGTLDYGEDMSLKMPDGTLHLAVVQPRVAHHAKVLGIDISEAEKMPGVVKVITYKDCKGNNRINQYNMHKRAKVAAPSKIILVEDTIFRYGDVIAVVAADTRSHAREAAKHVKMEYEKLPEYLEFLDAVTPDAMQVHPTAPNIFLHQPVVKGDSADEVIEDSAYAVRAGVRSPREPHLSIEGDIIQAYMDEDGVYTFHCKSQAIYANRSVMGRGIGLEQEQIRIVHNAVGGSFGWSTDPTSLSIVGICAMALDAPVSLVMSYEEHQHFSGKRTPAHINGRLACDEDGLITALEYDVGLDAGAFTEGGAQVGKMVAFGNPYKIPNVRGLIRVGVSNHNMGVAYRGFGFPEVTTSMETLMDMLAEEAGIDPFEFRYKNILREGDLTVYQRPLHFYPYERMMDEARPYYQERAKWAATHSTDQVKYGVGVAGMFFNPMGGPTDFAEAALELMPDGKIRVYNTWQDVGQGGDSGSLSVVLEALKPLDPTPDMIQLHMNDSRDCPNTGISASSRSHYMGGNAMIVAADKLLAAMRKGDGTFRTYDEMVAEGIETKYLGRYEVTGQVSDSGRDPDTGAGDSNVTGIYGFCVSTVAVDMGTGKAKCVSIKMWADAGVIGNYLNAEGQGYGGLSHNVGFALSEDYHDVEKHNNILGAGIPYIEDVPDDMEIIWLEDNKRPGGPYGSSGLSELFQCGEHMSIINGIYAATGVRIFELPAYPEKIKAGIDKLAKGEKIEPPAPYYLGPDLYDELDEIARNPMGT